jgi:hypothetical protein
LRRSNCVFFPLNCVVLIAFLFLNYCGWEQRNFFSNS